MKKYLDEIVNESRSFVSAGKVATYIPELAYANPGHVGIGIYTVDNQYFESGDTDQMFSIQSVGKVFSLICALRDTGLEDFLTKVDVEPSGDKYDSLIKLETMNEHRPLNPFINAGAIAAIGLVKGDSSDERFNKILNLIREMTDNDEITFNQKVFDSEMSTGNTNRAIAYYLKGAGIIEGNVDEILETYIKLCSIEASVKDMAKAASVISNNGIKPWNGEVLIDRDHIKILRALMTTSGLYDGSGDFSVKVGIPSKSGVGGCILGAVPDKMGIVTFGPSLNAKGNSIAGLYLFEAISKKYDLSVF